MTIKDELCPRIKADARLMGDGTLWINTDKLDKVGRVLVEHGTRCKQFYQDAPEPCEDAVSRKAVKDGFVEMCNLICPYTEKQRHAMCGSCLLGTAFDVLEATQSVTPKQRTGKWIPWEYARPGYEYKFHKCSVCGVCDEYVDEVPRPNGTIARIERIRNYCPNCGAKMDGKE